MTDPISDFRDALAAAGYSLRGKGIDSDDRWHRCFYGDEKHSSGRYRVKLMDDGFAIGSFGSDKDPAGFHKWHSKSDRKLTREEAAEARRQQAEFKAQKNRELEAKQARTALRVAKLVKKLPAAQNHPYLTKKKIGAHRIKVRKKGNELIIPMYDTDGRVWNIQKIQPSNWKGFFKSAKVLGGVYPIGRYESGALVICEGFATGASIHEATGLPVRVAFNTANLKPVALALRKKYPDARIVICADNDRWTFKPGKAPQGVSASKIAGDDPRWVEWRNAEMLWNPGIDKAQQAAVAIGGAVVITPEFGDHHQKPTDFNDLSLLSGAEAVKSKILEAIEHRETVPDMESYPYYGSGAGDSLPPDDYEQPPASAPTRFPFRILGHDNNQYYFFPRTSRQIFSASRTGLASIANLFGLAPLEYWNDHFNSSGKLNSRKIGELVANALVAECHRIGVFLEEDSVRGAGAWVDEGRMVLHCGDRLYVDGEATSLDDIRTEHIYISARRLIRPAREALSNYEAVQLRKICEAVTWENKLSGSLLAGWLVIAPICAALQYRPHLYITGEAESGKSTVVEKIIKPVLGKLALCVDGGTTEPAIRETMGYDGRPLIFDEGEPSASMPEVIRLARKASTGAIVRKFGQRPFKARFAACFSAITPPIRDVADESRISFMVIKKNRRSTAIQEYDDLLAMIDEVITEDFPERLIARTLSNMNSLLANIRVFQKAFRKVTGGARAAQQIGTMLAGLYSLHKTDVITEEAAIEWVKKYEWNDHTILDQEGDPMRLVQWITASLIKHSNGSDMTVGELIERAYINKDDAADKKLRNYGIAVRAEGFVDIASRSQNFAKLLTGTDWQEKWSRPLSDVPGAIKRPVAYFSRGVKTSAISLPIALFMESEKSWEHPDDHQQEEIPYDYY